MHRNFHQRNPSRTVLKLLKGFDTKKNRLHVKTTENKPVRMDTLAFLGDFAPGFAVKGCQVKVLTEPSDFFQELCQRSEKAQDRIAMAALYLGTGEKAQTLVESVRKSLKATGGRTRTTFLLDYCRGNRLIQEKSSCSMLLPLLQDFQNSCTVSLYHTPQLRGLKKKIIPAKFNETIGLQHTKLYVFDNSVLISGANLSTDYFTNRQDRYILIEECEPLATFCESLIQTIGEFSLQLQNDGSFCEPDTWEGGHPYNGDYNHFISTARTGIQNWLSEYHTKYQLKFNAEKAVFQPLATPVDCPADTWIFPSIQMGPFDITHDSDLTKKFLQSGAEGSKFKVATGYFNPTNEYKNVMVNSSKASYDVLCAHPTANGFLGARFPAGGVPYAYSLILKQFFEAVTRKSESNRISLFEYMRSAWTFHAKGLWYYLPESKYPIATMVGSANYGYRSVEKDLEAQMTIVTRNPDLQKSLHHEENRLFQSSEAVTKETLTEKNRPIPLWVKCVIATFPKLF